MLLLLAEYLTRFDSAFGVFQYLTLRGILAAGTALAISLAIGPFMIRRLQLHQVGQSVRSDGPQSHLSKAGTPTMGGALLLLAICFSTLMWGDLRNPYLWLALLVTFAFGTVGWVDDYRKVVEGDSRGLPARWKYLWQSLCTSPSKRAAGRASSRSEALPHRAGPQSTTSSTPALRHADSPAPSAPRAAPLRTPTLAPLRLKRRPPPQKDHAGTLSRSAAAARRSG